MTQAEGARAADALCDRDGGPPQALVCANDQMAVGALHALERRGLTVPDDVAVTGFDGIPGRLRPPHAHHRPPAHAADGEEAVELLVRRLSGTPGTDPVSLMLPVTVARRASCGCGPEEQTSVAIGA